MTINLIAYHKRMLCYTVPYHCTHCTVFEITTRHTFFFGGLRIDGGVEGLELTLSHKNTKVTTSC